MKKILSLCLALLLILPVSGCSSDRTYITYSVYPVGYLIDRIVGDSLESYSIQENELVQTANVVANYQELLDHSLYFFHIGSLEPYLELYSNEIESSGVQVVDLSELNAIYKFQRYTLVYVDGNESYIESPYYSGDCFNAIDTNENDLALWTDPIGMLSMAERIYNIFATNYVERADVFSANYEALKEDLIRLDASYQELAQRLKDNNQTIKFVTMTPNLGNWQKAYGFQIYPVCMSKYGTLPTDQQLQLIKERIVADNVQYIAYEPNMTDEMIALFNELETELGLTRVNISNLSSLTPSQIAANKDYLSIMYENLNVLENLTTDVLMTLQTNGSVAELIEE